MGGSKNKTKNSSKKTTKRTVKTLNYASLNAQGFDSDSSVDDGSSPVRNKAFKRVQKKKQTNQFEVLAPSDVEGGPCDAKEVVDDVYGATAEPVEVMNSTVDECLLEADEEANILENELRKLEKEEELRRKFKKNQELREKIEKLKRRGQSADAPTLPQAAETSRCHGETMADTQNKNNSSFSDNLLNFSDLRDLKDLEMRADHELRSRDLLGRQTEEVYTTQHAQGADLHTARGKISNKSGLDIGINDGGVKFPQRCPHTALQNEFVSLNLTFRKLDLRLFVLGELEILSGGSISKIEKEGRERLLKRILYHSGHFDWQCMLDLYAAVIKKIESGERSWAADFTDLEHMILTMRPKTISSGNSVFKSGGSASGLGFESRKFADDKQDRVLFCNKFQRGECTYVEPHLTLIKGKQVIVQHICASCWLKEKRKCFHAEKSEKCPLKNDAASLSDK